MLLRRLQDVGDRLLDAEVDDPVAVVGQDDVAAMSALNDAADIYERLAGEARTAGDFATVQSMGQAAGRVRARVQLIQLNAANEGRLAGANVLVNENAACASPGICRFR